MFTKSNYLIKEHVAFLKLVDKYDIIDPETGLCVAYAKENINGFIKILRLLVNKNLLPTSIEIKATGTEEVILKMRKPIGFLRSKVFIQGKDTNEIGYFKSRILTIGGRFDVFKMDNSKIAEVKGNWSGWNFKFIDNNGKEMGEVSKKWGGIGKELFTSADNYMISLNPTLQASQEVMALLITAGLAIDIVYKERK